MLTSASEAKTRDFLTQLLAHSESGFVVVAEREGAIVGFAAAYFTISGVLAERLVHLGDLFVRPPIAATALPRASSAKSPARAAFTASRSSAGFRSPPIPNSTPGTPRSARARGTLNFSSCRRRRVLAAANEAPLSWCRSGFPPIPSVVTGVKPDLQNHGLVAAFSQSAIRSLTASASLPGPCARPIFRKLCMKLARALPALLLCVAAFGAEVIERPPAPPGFQWKLFDDVRCEIRVPDGWHEAKRTAGLTQVLLLSPHALAPGQGLDVGLKLNTVKCQSQEQWNEALKAASSLMSDLRTAIDNPVESRIDDKPDSLLMIIEGERVMTTPPHPKKKYHVRTIMRAVRKQTTIYLYSFTAPAEQWDEAWKTGKVMLEPLWFNVEK